MFEDHKSNEIGMDDSRKKRQEDIIIPFDFRPDDAQIGLRECRALLGGRSKSSIYADMAAGRWPKNFKPFPGCRFAVWRLGDIRKKLAECGREVAQK